MGSHPSKAATVNETNRQAQPVMLDSRLPEPPTYGESARIPTFPIACNRQRISTRFLSSRDRTNAAATLISTRPRTLLSLV